MPRAWSEKATRQASKANRRNYAGIKIGRLTAVKPLHSNGRRWIWEFHCDCGNTVAREAAKIVQRKSPNASCGCRRAEGNFKAINQWRSENPNWKKLVYEITK